MFYLILCHCGQVRCRSSTCVVNIDTTYQTIRYRHGAGSPGLDNGRTGHGGELASGWHSAGWWTTFRRVTCSSCQRSILGTCQHTVLGTGDRSTGLSCLSSLNKLGLYCGRVNAFIVEELFNLFSNLNAQMIQQISNDTIFPETK